MSKLSIIIPVYQVEKYVHQCLESVFRQDLDDKEFEVIIVNDGTKDRSMEVIQDIIDQHNNITVINQQNQGLSMARNNGMAIARGEYIAFVDSDDMLVGYSLKPLIEEAIKTKPDLVVTDHLEIKGNENEPQCVRDYSFVEMASEDFFIKKVVPAVVWRTLYRREFLLKSNLAFIPNIYFEDTPFTASCYLLAGTCLITNSIFYRYRLRQDSIAASDNFTLRKANDLCVSIAETWKTAKSHPMSPKMRRGMNEYIYSAFNNLLYRTLYGINGTDEKVNILKTLKKRAPDLKFTNGVKQVITSFIFRSSPEYFTKLHILRMKLKDRLRQYRKQ